MPDISARFDYRSAGCSVLESHRIKRFPARALGFVNPKLFSQTSRFGMNRRGFLSM